SGPAPLSIVSIGPKNLKFGNANLILKGTGFIQGAVVMLEGAPLKTRYFSSKKLSATATLNPIAGNTFAIVVKNGDNTLTPPFPLTVAVAKPKVSYAAAFRFLEQASWGPTTADVVELQQVGIDSWLSAQLSTPPTLIGAPSNQSFNTYAQAQFILNAMGAPDQLRQRVAFALGQVFVISGLKIPVQGMVPYLNLLSQNAFGNFKDLMKAVTLSPAMGHYLDMVDNDKPNPNKGTLPNENYAREFLQLFTIGTIKLNADGSPQLDQSSQTIPTYDQTQIQQLARVFTGWTYPPLPNFPSLPHNPQFFVGAMVPTEGNHDMDVKTVFGQALPAGQSAEQDLDQTIGIVFNHPNVGPFIALRLIQHLVTSNPSPAYIQRIATVFANNGSGVRGDLSAVVRAILLDPEARQGDAGSPSATGGHLREPVLFATAILRALNATLGPGNFLAEYINGYGLGQELLYPPSVFNYYSPFSRIPGGQLLGPEFQLLTPSTAVLRANFVIGALISAL
ncbi:MAG TPA: DUF1800 domain-containing protein, partial [Candidatus Acidoferrales bacterium]|nr:DUF1800 domain-containing protein [Candidatus Acidoferrales bacterium]